MFWIEAGWLLLMMCGLLVIMGILIFLYVNTLGGLAKSYTMAADLAALREGWKKDRIRLAEALTEGKVLVEATRSVYVEVLDLLDEPAQMDLDVPIYAAGPDDIYWSEDVIEGDPDLQIFLFDNGFYRGV